MLTGVSFSVSCLVGMLSGGVLADRLARKEPRLFGRLLTIPCAIGAAAYVVALASAQLWVFLLASFLANLSFSISAVMIWPAVHAVCGTKRRATAVAILQATYAVVGAALGPFITGMLSDWFSSTWGAESLRGAFAAMLFFVALAAVAFQRSGRALVRDMEC